MFLGQLRGAGPASASGSPRVAGVGALSARGALVGVLSRGPESRARESQHPRSASMLCTFALALPSAPPPSPDPRASPRHLVLSTEASSSGDLGPPASQPLTLLHFFCACTVSGLSCLLAERGLWGRSDLSLCLRLRPMVGTGPRRPRQEAW